MPTTLDVEALVASQSSGRSNGGCQTCYWLSTRTAEEQAKWDKVLADPQRWTHAAIFRAIKIADPEAGTPGKGSVENHRTSRHRGVKS